MTDSITSQNNDLSSWITLYCCVWCRLIQLLFKHAMMSTFKSDFLKLLWFREPKSFTSPHATVLQSIKYFLYLWCLHKSDTFSTSVSTQTIEVTFLYPFIQPVKNPSSFYLFYAPQSGSVVTGILVCGTGTALSTNQMNMPQSTRRTAYLIALLPISLWTAKQNKLQKQFFA